jgi:hypothetical protein
MPREVPQITPGVSIRISSNPSAFLSGALSRIVHDGVLDRRKVKVARRAPIEWASGDPEREKEMTGGRRYGFGGKEEICGGFFGFCFSFGRRNWYCPTFWPGLGVIELDGSFGTIEDPLMVDERSRIWFNRVKGDCKIFTSLAGQVVQWRDDRVMVAKGSSQRGYPGELSFCLNAFVAMLIAIGWDERSLVPTEVLKR